MASSMKLHGVVSLLLLSHLVNPVDGRAELPAVAEILAIHNANRERLGTIHLQVATTHEWTDAHSDYQRQERKNCELILQQIESGALNDDNFDPNAKAAGITVEYLAQSMRDKLKHSLAPGAYKPFVSHLEIFVRGDEYQVRSPIESPDETSDWRFPAAPLTPQSLITDYARVRIHSRSATLEPPARAWCGVDSAGSPRHALLMSGHISDSHGENLPPYTQRLHPRWDYEHPIDAFFSAPADNYRVVGQEELDGRTLTIVEGLVPKTTTVSRTAAADGKQEQVQQVDFYRAWLDLDRGAIPLKMEQRLSSEGKDFDHAASGSPLSDCTTSQVKSLNNGAFYPAITVQEHYGGRYNEAGQLDSSVIHRRMTWNCTLVEAAVPDDEKFFVIDFPAGQAFFDSEAEKMVGSLEPAAPLKVGQQAPPLQIARWLDGEERTLEDFRGRVVVVDFWGLWCSACRNGVPALKEVHAKFKDQPVTFIAVHTAGGEPDSLQKRIEIYVDEQDWQFLHAIDAGTMIEDSATAHSYGATGYPAMFVIAPDGTIAYSSEIIPAEAAAVADLVGKTQEELTPDELQRAEAYERQQFAAAGVEFPASGALSAEVIERVNQVAIHFLSKQINAALQQSRD